MTNVCIMKNRLIYLVMCVIVIVLMPATTPMQALGIAGMLYPGATPYINKCICQPTLTYGLECMSSSAIQMRRQEYVPGSLGLRK